MHINKSNSARIIYEKSSKEIPLVTIAIPTYRRDLMLVDALASALMQDARDPIEIIVVDDDPESSANVLLSVDSQSCQHSLRYYVNDNNLGMFDNWNMCIALARGRWVTLLHDDDWLAPTFVSEMLPLAREGFDFAVCRVASGFSGLDPAKLRSRRDSSNITPLTLDDLIYGNPSPAPGILILKEALVATGGFDPAAFPCADYITYTRCARNVRAGRLNRTLAYYRTTDSQTFKGDTLIKMIIKSIEIKKGLLTNASAVAVLTYILSMTYWFRLARQQARNVDYLANDWRLKSAVVLSHLPVVAFALRVLRCLTKRLFF